MHERKSGSEMRYIDRKRGKTARPAVMSSLVSFAAIILLTSLAVAANGQGVKPDILPPPITETVPTTTTCSCTNPVIAGESYTCSATVSNVGTGMGAVAFTLWSGLGSCTVGNGGTCSIGGTATSTVGTYSGSCSYGGYRTTSVNTTFIYQASSGSISNIQVNSATPILSFASISTQTYGVAPFAVSASSASTGAITYSVASGPATISGSEVTITGAGTVVLSASQVAAGNYAAATASTRFAV